MSGIKEEPSKKRLKECLTPSGERVERLFQEAAEGRPRRRAFKKGLIVHLAYFIAHESHHRGNILLTLKQSGHPIDVDQDSGFLVVWHSGGSSGTDSDFSSIQGQRFVDPQWIFTDVSSRETQALGPLPFQIEAVRELVASTRVELGSEENPRKNSRRVGPSVDGQRIAPAQPRETGEVSICRA